jgi:hypothetical protein
MFPRRANRFPLRRRLVSLASLLAVATPTARGQTQPWIEGEIPAVVDVVIDSSGSPSLITYLDRIQTVEGRPGVAVRFERRTLAGVLVGASGYWRPQGETWPFVTLGPFGTQGEFGCLVAAPFEWDSSPLRFDGPAVCATRIQPHGVGLQRQLGIPGREGELFAGLDGLLLSALDPSVPPSLLQPPWGRSDSRSPPHWAEGLGLIEALVVGEADGRPGRSLAAVARGPHSSAVWQLSLAAGGPTRPEQEWIGVGDSRYQACRGRFLAMTQERGRRCLAFGASIDDCSPNAGPGEHRLLVESYEPEPDGSEFEGTSPRSPTATRQLRTAGRVLAADILSGGAAPFLWDLDLIAVSQEWGVGEVAVEHFAGRSKWARSARVLGTLDPVRIARLWRVVPDALHLVLVSADSSQGYVSTWEIRRGLDGALDVKPLE